MPREITSLRLEEDLLRRIDALAEKTGETRTAAMERLILIGLGEAENAVKLLTAPVVGRLVERMLGSERGQRLVAELLGESVDAQSGAAQRRRVSSVKGSRKGKG